MSELRMQFKGTKNYIATEDLKMAVNAAITLEKPLLVKGEPGTGKTELAKQIASTLNLDILEWNIKSTTRAYQGLYEYDAVSRLRDSQLGDEKVKEIQNYIKKGTIWSAFNSKKKVVLLIDEVDKADIEFPNDLLHELDKMQFHVYETGETVKAIQRPIVVITSNNEKELPDAFLRRCFFHYIRFPDKETLETIVKVHFPDIKTTLLQTALETFFNVREVPGLKKKPSTSEILDWIKLLLAEDISSEDLRQNQRICCPNFMVHY
tara:strand:- start:766 stop:1557 length:792 start_codon:yes stop_codon:yes gene_type:complete